MSEYTEFVDDDGLPIESDDVEVDDSHLFADDIDVSALRKLT